MKKGVNFKMSKRVMKKSEVILLSLVLLLGFNGLIVRMFVSTRVDTYIDTKNEIEIMSEECETLKIKYKSYDRLKAEIETIEFRKKRILSELPKDIYQEDILMSISDKAEQNKIAIESVMMTGKGKVEEFVSYSTGGGEWEEEVSPKDPIELEGVSIDFTAELPQIYSFIKNIEESDEMIVLNALSIKPSYAKKLSGAMELKYLSCDDGLLERSDIQLPESFGKTNPFKPFKGYSGAYIIAGKGELPMEDETSNFVVQVLDETIEGPTSIMGPYNRLTKEIYSASKDEINGQIRISETEGVIKCEYEFGNKVREEIELASKIKMFSVKVFSRKRVDEGDKQMMTLSIDNQTAIEVKVEVLNEDEERPLVKIIEVSENVDNEE